MSGLLKEIQILDISQQYSEKPGMHDSLPHPTASFYIHADKGSHIHVSLQKKQPTCTFCKGNHKANNYNVVVNPKERLAVMKHNNLCFKLSCKSQGIPGLLASNVRNVTTPVSASPFLVIMSIHKLIFLSHLHTTPTNETSVPTTMASTPLSALHTSVCLLKTTIAAVSLYTTIAEGHILFD